jgi:hypothetical protein
MSLRLAAVSDIRAVLVEVDYRSMAAGSVKSAVSTAVATHGVR